jgi:hypothetical protein
MCENFPSQQMIIGFEFEIMGKAYRKRCKKKNSKRANVKNYDIDMFKII